MEKHNLCHMMELACSGFKSRGRGTK